MTPERYERLCQLFDQAQAQPADRRAAFLRQVGADDPVLRAELERLLADDRKARAEQFLQGPCPVNARTLLLSAPATIVSTPPAGEPADALPAPRIGPSVQRDMQALRRRMKMGSLLSTLCFVAILALQHRLWHTLLTDPVRFLTQSPPAWWIVTLVPAALAALAGVLWSRRPLSLKALRTIELVGVALIAGAWAWDLHELLAVAISVPPGSEPIWAPRSLFAERGALWGLWLVTYGLFIPSTWRHCVAVVLTLAVVPLLVVGLAYPSPTADPAWSASLLGDVPWMALWLALGSVLAIYGAHKLTTLRELQRAARRLGQYTLKRRLGAGGMGEVYLAEHRLLERPCAVKLIRAERAGDAALLQRFEREVQAMTRLTHWNVVEVFDYGRTEDGTFYYVMEYVPGLTLERLVKEHGPLPPARAVHLLRQVCAALREAHALGLVHRDVKPGNVIVGERGRVYDVAKLLDFGLVQGPDLGGVAEKLTRYGDVVGTPEYLSPEQARGAGELRPPSDLYSLGALGYYLLTGQPPYVRLSVVQTITAHITDPVVPPTQLRPEIPADLERVILTCLEKDLDRRFPDAGRVEEALAGCTCAGAWTQADAEAWWQARAA